MFIKSASVTLTATSGASVSAYTTDVNGLLHTVQYKSTAGIPSSGMKCTVGRQGSSLNSILFFNKMSSGFAEFHPRHAVENSGSTLPLSASSALAAESIVGGQGSSDNRLKVSLSAASSATAGAGAIKFTFWYH